jgi:hypothetical protein
MTDLMSLYIRLQQQDYSDEGLAWTDAIYGCFEMMLHHFEICHTVVANCSGGGNGFGTPQDQIPGF